MKRVLGLFLAMLVVLVPSVGHAGGWAVASLDPLPPMAVGEEVAVGFQLLQHGVTPVDATEWPDAQVGISVRAGDAEWFVPAEMVGGAGSFVALVDVPQGTASLSLRVEMRNGLFVGDDWVDVTVRDASATAADGLGRWQPAWTMSAFGIVAAACVLVLVHDRRSSRRPSLAPGAPGDLVT